MPRTQAGSMPVTVLGVTDLACVRPSVAPDCKPGLDLQAVAHSGLGAKQQWLPETLFPWWVAETRKKTNSPCLPKLQVETSITSCDYLVFDKLPYCTVSSITAWYLVST